MHIEVTARLISDDGIPLLGYSVNRVVIMGPDAEQNMLDGATQLLGDVDSAKGAIIEQAAREAPLFNPPKT